MTSEEATLIVKAMEGNVPFFPREEAAQALIVRQLAKMVSTPERGIWLAARYAELYTEWNFKELRAVYCSKFRPEDGIEANSAVYLDGIPSERPQASPAPALAAADASLFQEFSARLLDEVKDSTSLEPIGVDPELDNLLMHLVVSVEGLLDERDALERLIKETAAAERERRRPRTREEIEADLYRKKKIQLNTTKGQTAGIDANAGHDGGGTAREISESARPGSITQADIQAICPHDRLDEDGICHKCGADRRGI